MSKATDKLLGELHGKLAEQMLKALADSEKAQELLTEYSDELPAAVIQFLKMVGGANPSLLTAIAKFLKDNEITCAIEDNEAMTELQERLKNKRRKSVGNVIPMTDNED